MAQPTVTQKPKHTSAPPVKNGSGFLERRRARRAARQEPPALTAPERSTFPNPGADTQILPAVPAASAAPVEVIEHFTPAQLDPTPELVRAARIALSAINGDVHPGRALEDLRRLLPELDLKVLRMRRQARNAAGAEQLAAGLRASGAVGTLPPPGSDEGERAALRGAKTMVGRAMQAADQDAATGLMEAIPFEALLEPAAASPSGRVAGGGVVHRQHPGRRTALPACSDATPEGLAFVPSWRGVDCPHCLRQESMAPAAAGAAVGESPVHAEADGAAPPLPDEDADPGDRALEQRGALPRRVPNPLAPVESIPARLDADGRPEGVSPCEAQDVRAGEWLLDDGAWHLVRTAELAGEGVTLRLGGVPNPSGLHITAQVYAIGAAPAQALLAEAAREGADTTQDSA